MTLGKALDNFIITKQAEGLLEKSIQCYSDFCRPFVNDVGEEIEVKDLTKEIFTKYILKLQKRETLSKTSVATHVRHVKVFLLWIEEEYEVVTGAKKVKVPRTPKKVLRIYNEEEIQQIFSAVSADEEWIVERNCAIIAFMLDSGLRQNEICTLRTADIDFKNRIVKVCGKGDKERYVPFGRISHHYLKMYMKKCPYSEETFFVARRGGALSCNAVKLFITKISNKLPFEFSSHKLRHNFATNFCLNYYKKYGYVDINKLQILMGHEDIETTQKYVHVANKLIALQDNVSHLDNIYFGDS